MLNPFPEVIKSHDVILRYSDVTYHYDVALLELSEPVTFNEFVQPICLPERGVNFEGWQAYVTGWGEAGRRWVGGGVGIMVGGEGEEGGVGRGGEEIKECCVKVSLRQTERISDVALALQL